MAANKISKANKNIERRKSGVIRAHNDFFLSARYGLTLQEHRLIYFAILCGQQDGKSFQPVTTSIKEFANILDLKGQGYYAKIRKVSETALTRTVSIAYKVGDSTHYKQANWLSDITYHIKEGKVTITPNPTLAPFFEAKKAYSETEFYFLIKFTSQYSERLYEIIRALDFKHLIDLTIDDLRQRLGLEAEQYPNYADFKKRILQPAVNDINKFTNRDISFREKRGSHNKVVGIYFTIEKKEVEKLYNRVKSGEFTAPLSENEQQIVMKELVGEREVIDFGIEELQEKYKTFKNLLEG